ncbi:uncharacterized protein [Anoplolepis gracilipes]|uniref:uncharacterized protein n=1 Tax=Anoplolepis gracilipes TaxID=354296 RepID=UPI003B9FF260
MSTTGVSTRSTRLKSRHEPATKVASEKKLRSKKIVTTKNSQKTNISTTDKSLQKSKTNVSANNSRPLSKCLRPRQNKKNYCEDSKLLQQYIPLNQHDSIVILEKINSKNNTKVPVYKTMKSIEKSSENKNDVYDFMFDINDTMEKATKKKQKKKLTKQIDKKKDKITKKTTRKKVTIQSKIIDNEENIKKNKSHELDRNSSAKCTQSNPSDSQIKVIEVIESTKKDKKKIEVPETNADIQIVKGLKNKTVKKSASSNVDIDIQIVKELEKDREKKVKTSRRNTNDTIVGEAIYLAENFSDDRASPEQTQDTKKPKIISIENANNLVVLKSQPSNTEEFWPFRPKNIFNNKTLIKQQKNTLNCSLLTKSLSPVLKTTNTLDVASPWRPPTSMFSRTKHFIQSTPKLRYENKENIEMNNENVEICKENVNINNENEEDKENMEMNKKNKHGKEKERKKKKTLHKKHTIQRKLPINQTTEKVQAIDTNKHTTQAVPARISLGEIKNLLQTKPDNNDDKQATNQAHVEVDKSLTKQKDENLINFLNFSDTFDVMSETEKLSNFGTEVPLFMDIEPSHFSKPPQHSYRRKRAVKFDCLEDSGEEEEEEKENVKHHTKKKKLTKSEKENEKRVNEWIKSINSTFEEIDEYDLLIE